MTYILAEIASAHMGDPDLCIELIQKAKEAGADGVKVQVWFPEEGDFSHMMDKFIDWDVDLPRIKLHSPGGIELWGQSYGDKSKGLCIKHMHQHIRADSKYHEICNHIYGVQYYPTPPRLARLSKIGLGYADHTQAEEIVTGQWASRPLNRFIDRDGDHGTFVNLWAFVIPAMAIAAGAILIEKHICLNREELKKKSKDWVSSLEPHEFKEFVQFIREAETAL